MNLSTSYMGLPLNGPLVVSASPLSCDLDNIRRMEQYGAGAVVLWSLFEEQLKHDASQLDFYLQYGTERFAESLTYFPSISEYHLDSELYLEHIAAAKQAVSIPIIGSLNGISPRRMDRVCPKDRAGRRGRPGTQRVLYSNRSGRRWPESRTGLP